MGGDGVLGIRAAQNTRNIQTLSWNFYGLSGIYRFGLCGHSPDFANWNSNEYSYVTALKVQ
ncbi:MAG: hypothetical protein KDK89_08050 [Alphaproteobacteria bacterium]|nr:hypothetical protein [Alphaproteobacteria bacterium]